ncbi:hypothetical protein FKM82_011479 [Ascaphus truei]
MSRECGAGTFVNFATLERDGKLPYNWRRSIFAFLALLPSCLWTDYLLAFYINPCVTRIFYQRGSSICLERQCPVRLVTGIAVLGRARPDMAGYSFKLLGTVECCILKRKYFCTIYCTYLNYLSDQMPF